MDKQDRNSSVPRSARWRAAFAFVGLVAGAGTALAQDPPDRTVLPVAEPEIAAITEQDARNATPPARFEVKAPEGAPNVVIVLIDDIP